MLIDGLESCGLLVNHLCFYQLSHSDGTHSLQRIYWWASDVMLNFSKSVPVKKQTHLHVGWSKGEIFSLFLYLWVNCSLNQFHSHRKPFILWISLNFFTVVLCVGLSLLNVSWFLVLYSRSCFLLRPGHLHMTPAAMLCQLIWRGGMLGARVASLMFFCSMFHWWSCGVVGEPSFVFLCRQILHTQKLSQLVCVTAMSAFKEFVIAQLLPGKGWLVNNWLLCGCLFKSLLRFPLAHYDILASVPADRHLY